LKKPDQRKSTRNRYQSPYKLFRGKQAAKSPRAPFKRKITEEGNFPSTTKGPFFKVRALDRAFQGGTDMTSPQRGTETRLSKGGGTPLWLGGKVELMEETATA